MVGTIDPNPFKVIGSGSYYDVTVQTVVEARIAVPATVPLFVDGPEVPNLFPDGQYIAFLYSDQPLGSLDPNLGVPSYQWTQGRLGLFPIRAGKVYRQCTGVGTTPLDATGERQGETLTSFLARLSTQPQPTQDPRAHQAPTAPATEAPPS